MSPALAPADLPHVPAESGEDRLQTIGRLYATAELATALTRQLNKDLARIRGWDSGPRLGPLGYALGVAKGDAEMGVNRLVGLRNELQDLLQALQLQPPGRPGAE